MLSVGDSCLVSIEIDYMADCMWVLFLTILFRCVTPIANITMQSPQVKHSEMGCKRDFKCSSLNHLSSVHNSIQIASGNSISMRVSVRS